MGSYQQGQRKRNLKAIINGKEIQQNYFDENSTSKKKIYSLVNVGLQFQIKKNDKICILSNDRLKVHYFFQGLIGNLKVMEAHQYKSIGKISCLNFQKCHFLSNPSKTILDNILYEEPYNKGKVESITDILRFKNYQGLKNLNGRVGKGGINLLSSESKLVFLARFLYSENDVYIFEDVFTNISGQGEEHLFRSVVQGLLQERAVIFNSSSSRAMSHSSEVWYLSKEGSIIWQGSYSKISSSSDVLLHAMLNNRTYLDQGIVHQLECQKMSSQGISTTQQDLTSQEIHQKFSKVSHFSLTKIEEGGNFQEAYEVNDFIKSYVHSCTASNSFKNGIALNIKLERWSGYLFIKNTKTQNCRFYIWLMCSVTNKILKYTIISIFLGWTTQNNFQVSNSDLRPSTNSHLENHPLKSSAWLYISLSITAYLISRVTDAIQGDLRFKIVNKVDNFYSKNFMNRFFRSTLFEGDIEEEASYIVSQKVWFQSPCIIKSQLDSLEFQISIYIHIFVLPLILSIYSNSAIFLFLFPVSICTITLLYIQTSKFCSKIAKIELQIFKDKYDLQSLLMTLINHLPEKISLSHIFKEFNYIREQYSTHMRLKIIKIYSAKMTGFLTLFTYTSILLIFNFFVLKVYKIENYSNLYSFKMMIVSWMYIFQVYLRLIDTLVCSSTLVQTGFLKNLQKSKNSQKFPKKFEENKIKRKGMRKATSIHFKAMNTFSRKDGETGGGDSIKNANNIKIEKQKLLVLEIDDLNYYHNNNKVLKSLNLYLFEGKTLGVFSLSRFDIDTLVLILSGKFDSQMNKYGARRNHSQNSSQNHSSKIKTNKGEGKEGEVENEDLEDDQQLSMRYYHSNKTGLDNENETIFLLEMGSFQHQFIPKMTILSFIQKSTSPETSLPSIKQLLGIFRLPEVIDLSLPEIKNNLQISYSNEEIDLYSYLQKISRAIFQNRQLLKELRESQNSSSSSISDLNNSLSRIDDTLHEEIKKMPEIEQDPRTTHPHRKFYQALSELYTRTVVLKQRRDSFHLHSQQAPHKKSQAAELAQSIKQLKVKRDSIRKQRESVAVSCSRNGSFVNRGGAQQGLNEARLKIMIKNFQEQKSEEELVTEIAELEESLYTHFVGLEIQRQGYNLPKEITNLLNLLITIINKPRLLIVEEKFLGTSKGNSSYNYSVLRQQLPNTSILLVLDTLDLSEHINKLIIMKNGKIKERGRPQSLIDNRESIYRYLLERDPGLRDYLLRKLSVNPRQGEDYQQDNIMSRFKAKQNFEMADCLNPAKGELPDKYGLNDTCRRTAMSTSQKIQMKFLDSERLEAETKREATYLVINPDFAESRFNLGHTFTG